MIEIVQIIQPRREQLEHAETGWVAVLVGGWMELVFTLSFHT